MPKKKVPSYRLHRQSGQAVVTLTDSKTKRRHDVLLGEYNSSASRIKYVKMIATWEEAGRVLDMAAEDARKTIERRPGVVTVSTVALNYWRHVKARYQTRRNRSRLFHVRVALKLLRSKYGGLPAAEFGPLALRKVREAMIGEGWARSVINDRVRLIQSAFEHAVSVELVGPDKLVALKAVRPLKRNEGGKESGKVLPVPEPDIDAIRPYVSSQVWALIQLQLFTGARAGELVIMRMMDIDTTGKVWLYCPEYYKTQDRGHARVIYLGPKSQAIIKEFKANRALDAYLFSPREAFAERMAKDATGSRRPNQKPNPRKTNRRIRDHYKTASYRRAITEACKAAGVDTWTPHRLRHNAATTLRKQFGIEDVRPSLDTAAPHSPTLCTLNETPAKQSISLLKWDETFSLIYNRRIAHVQFTFTRPYRVR